MDFRTYTNFGKFTLLDIEGHSNNRTSSFEADTYCDQFQAKVKSLKRLRFEAKKQIILMENQKGKS